MEKANEYFELLSEILAEENTEALNAPNEADILYDIIYSQIDNDLLRGVEKVCFEGKYNIIDGIKDSLKKFKLFLYFPELAGKTVISFYNQSKWFTLRNMRLPENIPLFFCRRSDKKIHLLNPSENIVSLDYGQYKRIEKLLNKGFDADELMKMLSFPIDGDFENEAFMLIPNRDDFYSEFAMELTDILAISVDKISKFYKQNTIKKFPNIKIIITVGTETEDVKKICGDISDEYEIKIENSLSYDELFAKFSSGKPLDKPSDNFKISDLIECGINEISYFIASNIRGYYDRLKIVNKDILSAAEDDNKESLGKIKADILDSIENNTAAFNNINGICIKILGSCAALENILSKTAGIENSGNIINHLPLNRLYPRLYVQYSLFCENDRNNRKNGTSNKNFLLKYKALTQKQSALHSAAVEFYEEKQASDSGIKFLQRLVKDEFFLKAQILYGDRINYDENELARHASMLKNPETPTELYYLGIYYSKTDAEKSNGYLEKSLKMGCTKAGELLYERYTKAGKPIEWLCEMLVPTACYYYSLQTITEAIEMLDKISDDGASKTETPKSVTGTERSVTETIEAFETIYGKLFTSLINTYNKKADGNASNTEMFNSFIKTEQPVTAAVEMLDKIDNGNASEIETFKRFTKTEAFKKAMLFMRISAAQENTDSIFCLAKYYSGLYILAYHKCMPTSPAKQKEYFMQSVILLENCKKGNPAVCDLLADVYFLHKDYTAAQKNFKASKTGYSYFMLGKIYENGLGYAVDLEKALKFYGQAKKKNYNYSESEEAYERVAEKISARQEADDDDDDDYGYSGYSSSYSYESDSGCVKAGTKILTADNRLVSVEDIVENTAVRNCMDSVSKTDNELIKNTEVEMLYSINDDEPFMSLEHAVLTERGWCSLDPEASMSINRFNKVSKLIKGDIIKKISVINGVLKYEDCRIEKINIAPNTEKAVCYDLHFYDGYNSYYANGYPVLLNYPGFTLSGLMENIGGMTEEEKARFMKMSEEYNDVLVKAFGKSNMDMFFMSVKKN